MNIQAKRQGIEGATHHRKCILSRDTPGVEAVVQVKVQLCVGACALAAAKNRHQHNQTDCCKKNFFDHSLIIAYYKVGRKPTL